MIVLAIFLIFVPFYYNYILRKERVYERFNWIIKIGFFGQFTCLTASGLKMLFSELDWTNLDGLRLVCIFSVIIHLLVFVGEIKGEYKDDIL